MLLTHVPSLSRFDAILSRIEKASGFARQDTSM
jgi:hypothetical protein